MNELMIFKNQDFGEIRTVTIGNEPWFIAKDACDILEIGNTSQALSRLDDDEKNTIILNEGIGNPNKAIVNEFGLYSLVLSSRKPEAKQFKRWITHDVLPQIRKTGSYLNTAKLSPELQLLNTMVMTMAKQELETKALQEAVIETKEEIREMREVVEVRPYENWRELTNKLVSRICQKTGDYKDTRIKIYDAVNRRAGVDIKRRLENMRNRAIVEGMSRSKAAELTYLDVISEDRKLIEIYTAIVKELAVKKGVSL